MIVIATYTSVWDGGTEIETTCKFDTVKNMAFDIESSNDVEGLDILDREYISLQDGTIIDTFFDKDNDRHIVNGESEE